MSLDEKEKVLNKIQKLVTLAGNNPSQEEAESAMLKAQELLLANGLEMTDVEDIGDSVAEETPEEEKVDLGNKVIPRWQQDIIMVLAKNFRVSIFTASRDGKWTGSKMSYYKYFTLVGMPQDVKVAKAMIMFAFDFFLKSWDKYRKENTFYDRKATNVAKRSYTRGFIASLDEKFRKQVEEKALVLVKNQKISKYLSKNYNLHSTKRRALDSYNPSAYERGATDGQFVDKDAYIA